MIRADSVPRAFPLFQAEGGGALPTSALQLRIETISWDLAAASNRAWHSKLPEIDKGTSRRGMAVCYGAFANDTLYAVAIWSSPVTNHVDDGRTIELRRFAISAAAPKNTASRMLAVMTRLLKVRFPMANRLISYQATAVHAGTIYKAAGWTAAHFSKKPKWGTRMRRKPRSEKQAMRAVGGYVTTPATRKPPQIISDKIRWEKLLTNEASGDA